MEAVVYDYSFPTILEWMKSLVSAGILHHSPSPTRYHVRYALTKNGVLSVYEIRGGEHIWIGDYLATEYFYPERRIGLPYRNLIYISGDQSTYQLDCDTVDPDAAPFCADLDETSKQRLRQGIRTYPLYQVMQEADGQFQFLKMGLDTRDLPVIGITNLTGPQWEQMVDGHGMIIYGFERDIVTISAPELQDEQVPQIREEDRWLLAKKINFIIHCTDVALKHLHSARQEIDQELDHYENQRGEGGKWDFPAYYRELIKEAHLYKAVVEQRDFLQTLADALNPSLLTSAVGLILRGVISIPWAVREAISQQQFAELAREVAHWLSENPIRLEEGEDMIEISTLNQFVDYYNQQLREMNQLFLFLAPGRVGYEKILEEGESGAETIRAEIMDKLIELRDDNQQAQEYMLDDRENIQSPLRDLHSYRVLILPGITEQVLREHRDDWRYVLAAHFLMGDQTAFQLIMTVSEIFTSMFFPPLGVLLGIYNAALQIDEAVFADAISDSTLNVDDAYLSQSEARSMAIWAGVAAGFSAFDALGAALRTAGKITRIIRKSPIDDIDGVVGDEAAHIARAVQKGGKTVERVPEIADVGQHIGLLRRNLTAPHEKWFANVLDEPDILTKLQLVRNAKGKIPVLSAYRRYYRKMIETLERLPESQRAARYMPMSVDEFVASWKGRCPFLQGRRRLDLLEAAARDSDSLKPFEFLRQRAGKDSLRELFRDIPELRRALQEHMETLAHGSDEFRTFQRISDELSTGTGPVRDHIARFRYLERNLPTQLRQNPRLIDDLARIENIQNWLPSGASADIADEAREAFHAIARLMGNQEIDPRFVARILNHPNLRGNGRRWALILDRLQGVEGFINRVAPNNPSVVDTLLWTNRGYAFEALVASRVDLRFVERISLGNRFKLPDGQLLEADLLVRFRDGKQLLVDAKFWEPGSPFMGRMVDHARRQMRKMHQAIMTPDVDVDINIAEFWVSHSAEAAMRTELARLASMSPAARDAVEKIHIVTNVIAEDWTEWFLRTDVPLTWTDFEVPLLGRKIPLGSGTGGS